MRSFFFILSLLAMLLPHQAQAFKCWTNNEGVRECGNVVPPEYAQQKTRTINERGITTEVQERAKTKEELAEEQRKKEEEQLRMEQEKARRAKQDAFDKVLMMTFTSEKEIIASRDRKLAAIQGTIEITEVMISKFKEKLAEKKQRAANLERRGKKIPDDLLNEIGALNKQAAEKKAYIVTKQREQEQLRQKYAVDLKRYREITGKNTR